MSWDNTMWEMWMQAMLIRAMCTSNSQEQPKSDIPPLEIYQQEAIDFIYANWNKKTNTLCALDVGMGKTRVACEILSRLFDLHAEKRLQGYALVCCPSMGLIETIWADTLKAFGIKMMILEGEQFKRIKMKSKKILTIPDLTVCLVTYANLIKGDNIDYLINTPPNLIVFDEYHILTNSAQKKEQQYRETIKKLPLRFRIGLTATPFINHEMESVLAYGLLNDAELVDKFHSADVVGKKMLVQNVKEKNFLFHKENPYNLTQVSEWLVSIPMGTEHYNQYITTKNKHNDNHMSTLHQIGKLSVSSILVDKAQEMGINQRVETGKIKAIKSIVSSLPAGDKVVICDNYRETLNHIRQLDFIRPLKPVLYVGGRKYENRKSIESFNNRPECRVLLTTRQEGGEGLNLQAANHLILINCWYTAKDIIQILGRIKRKGQKKPVYAYILGYNLFECLGPGKKPEAYFLEEDEGFYKMVRQKAEMCEEWGIEVKNKLPEMKLFPDFPSFENEFNNFLGEIIMKEDPKIAYDGLNDDMDKQKREHSAYEARMRAFYEEEEEIGKSYLKYASSQYMNFIRASHLKEQQPERTKIIKVRKKPVQNKPKT